MPSASPAHLPAIRTGLLLVLALLATTGPFALDMYLPAFPEMAEALGVGAAGVQLTLTAFLLGMGLGQLVFGSLSDRYGRKRPLLIGSAVFVLSSVAAAAAPALELLIAARFLQGLGAAAGVVIGRAIVSDLLAGPEAARIFTIKMTLGSLAAVIAPVSGSLVADHVGWRGILGLLALLAALMLAGVIGVVRETRPPGQRSSGPLFAGLWQALRTPRFMAYVLVGSCSFGVLMAYIAASPFVYQRVMGLNPLTYGIMFATNATGLILAGAISARIALKVPQRRTLGVALPVTLAMALVLLLLAAFNAPPPLFALPIFGAVSSLGFVLGNTTALALSEVRSIAGSGSAALGSIQFLFGALLIPLVGIAGETSVLPLALVMTASALGALAALLYSGRQGRTRTRRNKRGTVSVPR